MTVLLTSDLHFEEEDEQFRERTLEELLELGDAGYAWVPGDVGEQEDWDRLEDAFSGLELRYSPGNMDSLDGEGYYADRETTTVGPEEDPKLGGSGVKTGDVTDFVKNVELFEEEVSGNGYKVLFSHNPRHVGIDPWEQEFIPDGENDRGRRTADHGFYDIIVTAHYHTGDAYVNENGALVVQSPSAQENYREDAPERTAQLLEMEGEDVTVRERDLEDGEIFYEKSFRYDGDGFREL
ncbi:MAG: hypothetical protein ABEK01_05925 [Candidatus Nanohaloarchaea archaeon]